MDAKPILARLARLLAETKLEAIVIGNAGAALQGVPVSTIDIDFFFRQTPANVRKLKRIASALGATIYTPFYPASGMFRLQRDSDGLQVDFMGKIHGLRSFESTRSRAMRIDFDGHPLFVASLADIIKSKEAAGRSKDTAVLKLLKDAAKESDSEDNEEGSTSG
jgi:predicted nucleotidyltransferase